VYKRAEYIVDGLKKCGYDGIFFDWGNGLFLREHGYESINATYYSRHSIPYSEAAANFISRLRKMYPEIIIENNQGYREAEAIEEEIASILKRREAIREKEKIERTIVLTDKGWEIVRKGITIEEEISQLTPEIIRSGEWKKKKFRKYDVKAFAPSIYPGKLHPLTQLIEKIRKIFAEMGFKEIKGSYIESCLWNMDALFIPQDHPARDMQDTFYCKKPSTFEIDDSLLKKIARVHEDGGETGSKGWGYRFDENEAKRALLRTHTTVNTIRYLANNPEPPAKVFSIERVFRRENIDSTHLHELLQFLLL